MTPSSNTRSCTLRSVPSSPQTVILSSLSYPSLPLQSKIPSLLVDLMCALSVVRNSVVSEFQHSGSGAGSKAPPVGIDYSKETYLCDLFSCQPGPKNFKTSKTPATIINMCHTKPDQTSRNTPLIKMFVHDSRNQCKADYYMIYKHHSPDVALARTTSVNANIPLSNIMRSEI